MKKILTGSTRPITWVNSGVTPSPLYVHLVTGSETSINSASMSSSGNGHYYYNMTYPDTPGFYVTETNATIGSKVYKKREKVQVVIDGVD